MVLKRHGQPGKLKHLGIQALLCWSMLTLTSGKQGGGYARERPKTMLYARQLTAHIPKEAGL